MMNNEIYTIEEVYAIGFYHGKDLFECNVCEHKDYHAVIDGETDDDFNVSQFEDDIRNFCWEADEGYRQYSPFEFFCKSLNDDDNSEELWEMYEKGIGDGIEESISELTANFYMDSKEVQKVIEQWLENKND